MTQKKTNDEHQVNYDVLKSELLLWIERDWGTRCDTTDIEDFPDLHDNLVAIGDSDAGRCGVCLVYEKFDKFWKYFTQS